MRHALLLILFLVPAVAAHPEAEHMCDTANLTQGLTHLQMWDGELAPGESRSVLAAFEAGCPLREDWWVMFWMEADPGLELDVLHEGTPFGPWPMDERYQHIQLPEAGYPELTVRNVGDSNASFRLYFDQTCDCQGKAVPVSPGAIWLNTAVSAGDEVAWELRIAAVKGHFSVDGAGPENLTVTVHHVQPEASGFKELHTATRSFGLDDACGEGAVFVACMGVTFPAAADGQQYLWVEVEHDGAPGWIVQVAPVVDVTEAAPSPWLWTCLALLGAALLARR